MRSIVRHLYADRHISIVKVKRDGILMLSFILFGYGIMKKRQIYE